jgi:hypothetical protein
MVHSLMALQIAESARRLGQLHDLVRRRCLGLPVQSDDRLALRLGPDEHFGDDEAMASGDLVADILLCDLGPYVGDRDMWLVLMGRLSELYDLPEALMERVQLWTVNVHDDDGNLSGR